MTKKQAKSTTSINLKNPSAPSHNEITKLTTHLSSLFQQEILKGIPTNITNMLLKILPNTDFVLHSRSLQSSQEYGFWAVFNIKVQKKDYQMLYDVRTDLIRDDGKYVYMEGHILPIAGNALETFRLMINHPNGLALIIKNIWDCESYDYGVNEYSPFNRNDLMEIEANFFNNYINTGKLSI